MVVPQRKGALMTVLVFSATLAVSSHYTARSAAARDAQLTPFVDRPPLFAEPPSPPPQRIVRAVLNAQRSTGIDPALLLAIAWTESRFRIDAKNPISSAAGLLQFTDQTWLESVKAFGHRHGMSRFADLIHRSDAGYLIVDGSAKDVIWKLRNEPRIATLLAAERLYDQKEHWQNSDRPLQLVDLYLVHALGVAGANRFSEAVTYRPSAPCKDVVGNVAWSQSGLFVDLPQGPFTSVITAYDAISVRLEERRSYYARLLQYYVAAAHLEVNSKSGRTARPF